MSEKYRTIHATKATPNTLTSVAAGIMIFAVSKGIPAEQIAAETGYTQTDLLDPNTRLPEDVAPRMWRLLNEAFPGEVMSLEMANTAPFSVLGVIAQGMESAPTLRAAIELVVSNRAVLSDRLQVSVIESSRFAKFVSHHPIDELDGGAGAEMGFAIGARLLREAYKANDMIHRVDFSHQPFGPVSVYEDFFGVDVHFGQTTNAMVFYREALDRKLERSDALQFNYVKTHLQLVRDRLSRAAIPEDLRRVYDAISRNAEAANYGAEAVAERLNMSLRSLQRLTRRHGIEIRRMIEEEREANARQLLGDRHLSTDMIAHVLGYSDDRAFRRAFKRWSGRTPAEYRKSTPT